MILLIYMKIFEHDSYKKFLKEYLRTQPKHGYGYVSKFAKAMQVSTAMVSQVLSGPVDISIEQAIRLGHFLNLTEDELDYLVNLVSLERSSDHSTKLFFKKRIDSLRIANQSVKTRLKLSTTLNENDQAQYYSEWFYSAVWLLTSIPEFSSRAAIAERLQLRIDRVSRVVDDLIRYGLLSEKNGKLKFQGQQIHISSDTPLVYRHHANWRWTAVNRMEISKHEANLHFTGPVVISKSDCFAIREILLSALEKMHQTAGPSECEELFCLNLDWFKV